MSIEVVLTRLDVAPETVAALGACLSRAECRRAARFHFERDRRRFVVARGSLRHLLAERLDTAPGQVNIRYGAHGKPAVDGIDFNVSHAGDWALFAFSREGAVGVDIEAIRPLPDADAIAERMFSDAENAAYAGLDAGRKPLGFFNCWTRKEAFVKAVGDGLSMPLREFDVTLSPDEPAQLLRVGQLPGDRSGWRMHGLSPSPGYVAALVARH